MTFVMIIWLAMGAHQIESFTTPDACFKRLDYLRAYYQKTYVIRASGCFPRELIIQANK
jgi:hypothetical protein